MLQKLRPYKRTRGRPFKRSGGGGGVAFKGRVEGGVLKELGRKVFKRGWRRPFKRSRGRPFKRSRGRAFRRRRARPFKISRRRPFKKVGGGLLKKVGGGHFEEVGGALLEQVAGGGAAMKFSTTIILYILLNGPHRPGDLTAIIQGVSKKSEQL